MNINIGSNNVVINSQIAGRDINNINGVCINNKILTKFNTKSKDISDKFESISLSILNGNIEIIFGDKFEFEAEYSYMDDIQRDLKLMIQGSTLKLDIIERSLIAHINIKLYLPSSKKLKSAEIETKNSNIKIIKHNEYSINEVRLESTNGDIDVESSKINEFEANTTNGSIETSNISNIGKYRIRTTNGDIRLYIDYTKSFHVGGKTVNGSVKIDKYPNDNSVNHIVELYDNLNIIDIRAITTNGNIKVKQL